MAGNPTTADDATPSESSEPQIISDAPAQDRKTVKQEQRRELFGSPSFIIGGVILSFWVLCSIAPGLFTKWSENEVIRLADGSTIPRTGPGANAWFGTDTIGNDVFARVIYGADNVLINAPISALIAVLAGAVIGLIMGFYRGWVDEVLSRIIEAILSLPVILLALMVVVVFGNSRIVIVLTIAALFTPVVARTVRSAVMTEAQLDYVMSAKLRGESGWFIMMREIFPNITNVLIVEFTVRVGYAIFTVATLSFLGLGTGDQTAADWGVDIANGYGLIQSGQWWVSIFPALAIASLVISVNLIADSIEKVYNS